MLLSLQKELQKHLRSSISYLYLSIDQVEERPDALEGQITDQNMSHNDMVDAFEHQEDELCSIHTKLARSRRSRRNNIKFRG